MKSRIKLFHWLPRIICMLAILFISIFAADAFQPGQTIGQQLLAFFIHLIPSFILLAFLLVAWKWEKTGGILFIVTGLVMSPFIFMLNYNRNHSVGMSLGIILVITAPFIIAGLLFLWSQHLKKKHFLTGK